MADCPFCQRIEAREYDYFDDYSVAFEPLNPVTPGHFLVVPQVHAINALWAPEAAGHVMRFAAELADQMDLSDCNFITSAGSLATQSVMHLHVHVIPRHEGDGLWRSWPWPNLKRAGQKAL